MRSINLVVSFSFLQWSISNSLIADFLIQSILFYYFHFYCLDLLTKMLAKLPVEIILLICEYPEFKDLGQLAWTNKRIMQIIRKYLPIVLVLEGKTLFYRRKIFLYERKLILVFSTLWKLEYFWRKDLSIWFAYWFC